MKLIILLKLLRVHQWYKNLVVYLALIFSNLLFDSRLFLLTTLGLISLCLISSSNYIINDILDKKRDLQHPEKKLRPIASGEVTIYKALLISIILIIISFLLAYKLSLIFLFCEHALLLLENFIQEIRFRFCRVFCSASFSGNLLVFPFSFCDAHNLAKTVNQRFEWA